MSKKQQYFEKYYVRLMWEGILKSLICGFIFGFIAEFITAFLFWAFDLKGFWLSLVAGVGVGAVCTIIFYFAKFKPTTVAIAKRIDKLGLEERLITMTELENDDSYIAMRQREDAKEKLRGISTAAIRFAVPTIAIVFVSIAFAFGTSMTVVAGLSEKGIIKKGSEIIDDVLPDPPVEYIPVSYIVEEIGGGYIEGESEQLVIKGQDATTVIAVPDDGWFFYTWSDMNNNPVRTDYEVKEPIEVWAIFLPLSEGEGEGGEPGEGEPDPNAEPKPDNDPKDDPPKGDPAPNKGQGKYDDGNQIIDGQTYYRDKFDVYYAYAMELLAAGQEIPAELRQFIETYMGILK